MTPPMIIEYLFCESVVSLLLRANHGDNLRSNDGESSKHAVKAAQVNISLNSVRICLEGLRVRRRMDFNLRRVEGEENAKEADAQDNDILHVALARFTSGLHPVRIQTNCVV